MVLEKWKAGRGDEANREMERKAAVVTAFNENCFIRTAAKDWVALFAANCNKGSALNLVSDETIWLSCNWILYIQQMYV